MAGVHAALVSLQLADALESLAADGAGVDDAWRVAVHVAFPSGLVAKCFAALGARVRDG